MEYEMKRELEPQLRTKAAEKLFLALAKIDKPEDMANFLRDLLTYEEIGEASRRLAAAELLMEGKSIREVAKEIGLSTTTVSRIYSWLHHGMGGYRLALEKLKD